MFFGGFCRDFSGRFFASYSRFFGGFFAYFFAEFCKQFCCINWAYAKLPTVALHICKAGLVKNFSGQLAVWGWSLARGRGLVVGGDYCTFRL